MKKVLIIGSGIAGPALALFLKRAGFVVEICEAREQEELDGGFFLYLAPNGMNVLKTLGLEQELKFLGVPSTGIRFYNHRDHQIGELDSRNDRAKYGVEGIVIKRSRLHTTLRNAIERDGIAIHLGKKLTGLQDSGGQVSAQFQDGTTAHGDILIGCDGIFSKTRQLTFPSSPSPTYTGLIDCGGFTYLPHLRFRSGPQHMFFGQKAFFAYVINESGEVYWFSNVSHPEEPSKKELATISNTEWKDKLLKLHKNDPHPIQNIIRTTSPDQMGKWPLRDIPSLPTWHKGRVCLIGDAAHATSPSSGQGASLALESAIILAKCLKETNGYEAAFHKFQELRKDRVEMVIQQARRNGDRKIPHPFMGAIRDILLPIFLRAGTNVARQTYSYTINWTD